ncbi:hypothetical protein [Streptomyces candidus]|uniref:ElaB/YqjD/DUF883 family membrane-anchored ribosome-binding protein n=1 Tax=Streptomyces candidus TaxID=67283 RepID=A0A7X0HDV0_9ACTN|nr:hypothetical protein [Streptomyces candidus]MBB6435716.1 ElaB/YqjD/DUF883 family membrane-anchored ribosome-binding protein [Streptomyces candidus]GHH46405.1 hypothetical protein GCM10018773_37320 [Streptomyces candidus]
MAISDDLRKTLADPTPLYFVAGTADLAVQQAKKLAEGAPERFEKVRQTDPKTVQEKVTSQAKEAQATLQSKFTEVVGSFDTDLKKLGETAQDLALRSVGVAAEYAVKAREAYEKVAEHGEQAVKGWRGEAAEEINEIAIAVEPDPAPKPVVATEPLVATEPKSAGTKSAVAGTDEPKAAAPVVLETNSESAQKKAPARKAAAKKTAQDTEQK